MTLEEALVMLLIIVVVLAADWLHDWRYRR